MSLVLKLSKERAIIVEDPSSIPAEQVLYVEDVDYMILSRDADSRALFLDEMKATTLYVDRLGNPIGPSVFEHPDFQGDVIEFHHLTGRRSIQVGIIRPSVKTNERTVVFAKIAGDFRGPASRSDRQGAARRTSGDGRRPAARQFAAAVPIRQRPAQLPKLSGARQMPQRFRRPLLQAGDGRAKRAAGIGRAQSPVRAAHRETKRRENQEADPQLLRR